LSYLKVIGYTALSKMNGHRLYVAAPHDNSFMAAPCTGQPPVTSVRASESVKFWGFRQWRRPLDALVKSG